MHRFVLLVLGDESFDVAVVHLANCSVGLPGVPQIRRPSGDFAFIDLSIIPTGSYMDASPWWQRMRALTRKWGMAYKR